MIDIILDNPIRFILALVIGLATAWWIWGRLGSLVADTAGRAGDMAKGAADTAGGAAMGAAGAVGGAVKGAAGAAGDAASGAVGAVGDAASGAVDTAKGAAGAVVGGVAAAGAAAGAGAAAAASGAKDAVGDMIDKPKIAAAVGDPDDLTVIKGIGPKLNDLCQSLGVLRFDQIAKWGPADVAEVDQYLKIKGRIDRDRWVDQAKLLAAGDEAGHKAQFLS